MRVKDMLNRKFPIVFSEFITTFALRKMRGYSLTLTIKNQLVMGNVTKIRVVLYNEELLEFDNTEADNYYLNVGEDLEYADWNGLIRQEVTYVRGNGFEKESVLKEFQHYVDDEEGCTITVFFNDVLIYNGSCDENLLDVLEINL